VGREEEEVMDEEMGAGKGMGEVGRIITQMHTQVSELIVYRACNTYS
jgi:hypothetical protein